MTYVRRRYRNRVVPGGTFGVTIYDEDSGNVELEGHSCEDLVDAPDNGPLNIDHFEVVGGLINKPKSSYFESWFSGYLADALRTSKSWPHISPLPGHLSDAEYATAAVSRTNLSHPLVDVPANILEFGDNVRLLKEAGDIITKNFKDDIRIYRYSNNLYGAYSMAHAAADVNLAYSFGIAPVVGDAVNLIKLKDSINRRIQGFKRLHTKYGLRKTVPLAAFDESGSTIKVLQSHRAFISQDVSVRTRSIVKGHVRWLPDDYPDQFYSPDELWELARDAALGLEGPLGIGFSSLWEAMPWSWLIDWSSNLGNYLDSKRNVLPAKLGGVSIIEHTRTDYEAQDYSDGSLTMGAWRVTLENKRRSPTGVVPDVHMPFLEASQMGILASLLTKRA